MNWKEALSILRLFSAISSPKHYHPLYILPLCFRYASVSTPFRSGENLAGIKRGYRSIL